MSATVINERPRRSEAEVLRRAAAFVCGIVLDVSEVVNWPVPHEVVRAVLFAALTRANVNRVRAQAAIDIGPMLRCWPEAEFINGRPHYSRRTIRRIRGASVLATEPWPDAIDYMRAAGGRL